MQRTIGRPVIVKGRAAFFKEKAQLTLLPAEPNTGIVFQVGKTIIPATANFLFEDLRFPHTTILRKNNVQVTMVEHILAAVAGLGISNIKIVVLPNGQIPFCDGSSFEFCDALLKADLIPQQDAYLKIVNITKVFETKVGDSRIKIHPLNNGHLQIDASIEFKKPIGNQHLSYHHSSNAFCLELAWARTFAYNPFKTKKNTIKKLPGFFLKTAPYIDSNMIIYRGKKFISNIRRFDEPVRHKILDFVGDIALLDGQMQANISLFKPSHKLYYKFIREIWKTKP